MTTTKKNHRKDFSLSVEMTARSCDDKFHHEEHEAHEGFCGVRLAHRLAVPIFLPSLRALRVSLVKSV